VIALPPSPTPPAAEEPQVVHALPGRLRVHLPAWAGRGTRQIEMRLRQLPGVRKAQANGFTGNVLVEFDPQATGPGAILTALRSAESQTATAPAEEPPLPPVIEERHGLLRRLHIPVRGLDRDPHLARRVVQRLARLGARVVAKPLTGRVMVEFREHEIELEEILCEIVHLELPPLPGEDRPTHPLDPGPLLQSAVRVAGAGLGLAFIAARQLTGRAFPRAHTFATAAGVVSLVNGFPVIRNGLRRLLGRDAADLTASATGLVTNSLAGSPFNLLLGGAEAMRLLTEVVARRGAWRRYADRLEHAASVEPGVVVRLEAGDRPPCRALVIEGTGTAIGPDGHPVPLRPGGEVDGGAVLAGGPFALELLGGPAFTPEPRPAPPPATVFSRYLSVVAPASLGYAGLKALLGRSFGQGFLGMLLMNPRAAVAGRDAASLGAAARVMRAGVTVVGTRPNRGIRLPGVLLLDGPRLLTDGLEVAGLFPLVEEAEPTELLELAAGVAAASGSPWGPVFPQGRSVAAEEGAFDGIEATARVRGCRYALGPPLAPADVPVRIRSRHKEDYLILLRDAAGRPLAALGLRPRLAPGAAELVQACHRHGVKLGLVAPAATDPVRGLARRVGVRLVRDEAAVTAVRRWQEAGALVALATDSPRSAEAVEACDLAIGLAEGRTTRFAARVDLLAPDLKAVAAVIEAGALRELAVRDGVVFSALGNIFGAIDGLRNRPGIRRASWPMNIASAAALVASWLRLRGGARPRATLAHLTDPKPERWGRRPVAEVLHHFKTGADGLTTAEAARRRRRAAPKARRHELLAAVLDQLRYPMTGILAAGAGASLVLGAPLDAAIIAATVAVNVAVGAWQERQAGHTAEALEKLGAASARVLRDGKPVEVPSGEVVPGDVLLLASGDRVAADARVLDAAGLEVDEAALTGESLPVPKFPDEAPPDARVVLEGSGVVTGTGKAVAVAVGLDTRLGSTALALSLDEPRPSPLGARLGQIFRVSLPIAVGGGALAALTGWLRGQGLYAQLAIGASVALSVIPEGLPLMAGVGEAAVARRLAGRRALVHRLSAVEALGRVDVVCTDKTGTLTQGRLALRLVADADREAWLPGDLPADLRNTLLTAARACPHPDAPGVAAHPTDLAVIRAAQEVGLGEELRAARSAEVPFDPVRSFHATAVRGRLCVKGAPEALVPRCTRLRRRGTDRPLGATGAEKLLERAHWLAGQGLRVLMVAEGPPGTAPDQPQGLTALGFVGMQDPLRPGVAEAVERCRLAGVRVMMLTGDHPATARAIARDAGLGVSDEGLLTGADIAELHNGDLDRRIGQAVVIARATPLDKLRIVESLQRLGHTVAMTGDGVNDAPALRLADVGVAMGRGGTEVARQAAAVVLADDDFPTLVEAFVEGRGFWQNMRRSIGLLLGGNLGEASLVVGAGVLGLGPALSARQVLFVNLVTDALPALAVVLQRPSHRDLAGLAREGAAALDATLKHDIWRRGVVTAAPALAAFALAGGGPQASTVAFTGIVANQLTQTLNAGIVEGRLSRSVVGAVASSGGLLLSTLAVPPLRRALGLAVPTPLSVGLVGAGALATFLLDRTVPLLRSPPVA
jgi:calcium-translocating P-type ATPase